jgi:predicted permease
MREEMEFHRAARTSDLVDRGMDPEEAARTARLEFGNAEAYREECRKELGYRPWDDLYADLRYAVRILIRNRAFTIVAALSIGLGIGANVTIFRFANALLFRPLPVADPARVVDIFPGSETVSYVDYKRYRDENTVLSGLAAHHMLALNLLTDRRPERISGQIVTGNYFEVLGLEPAAGRFFVPEEDSVPLAHPVVVLHYGFWQRRYNRDPAMIGQTITLNRREFTVIGVAPRGFDSTYLGMVSDVWVPMMMQQVVWPGQERLTSPQWNGLYLTGRLKDEVSQQTAQSVLETVNRRIEQDAGTPQRGWGFVAVETAGGLHREIRNIVYATFALLVVIVELVLLLACSNVAGLLLAQAAARRKEIALRFALGASRKRLLAQMLTENIGLWMIGGLVGLALSGALTAMLMQYTSALPFELELGVGIDIRVLAFTLPLAFVTGLAFGLGPALQATKPKVVEGLKNEIVRVGGMVRLRHALVVGQVALSAILLIGAGLLVKSLRNAYFIDPGFDLEHGIVVPLELSASGYSESARRLFYDDAIARVSQQPGVASVAVAVNVPLTMNRDEMRVTVDSESEPRELTLYNVVGAGYFETMKMPIIRGRPLTDEDHGGAPGVVVINEAMARAYWPGGDPIGRRITHGGPRELSVIGIVADSKFGSLGERNVPMFFLSALQYPSTDMKLHVRTVGDPAPVLPMVRRAIESMDESLAVDASLLRDEIGIVFVMPRAGATLLSLFGVLGVLLACIGLFGVITQYVNQRAQEIGVRMALGARRREVMALIVRRGVGLTAVGVLIGLPLATLLWRLLSSRLYGVSTHDAVTLASVGVLLMIIGAVASLLPALKASRVDPVTVLRAQ